MRKGSAGRLCLFAILLVFCAAEDDAFQKRDNTAEPRIEDVLKSGAPNSDADFDESDEADTYLLPKVYLDTAESKRTSSPGQHYSSYDDLIRNHPYRGEKAPNDDGYLSSYNVHSPIVDSNMFRYQPRKEGIPVYIGGLPRTNDGTTIEAVHPSLTAETVDDGADDLINLYGSTVLQPEPQETLIFTNPEQDLYLNKPQQAIFVNDPYNTNGQYQTKFPSYASFKGGLISKQVLPDDLIYLDKLPGGKNALNCSKSGDIHQLWASGYGCMICICLKEKLFKPPKPVCASCAACLGPPPPVTPITLEPVTLSPPVAPSSCKPLPTNEPFPNPLDPCKVCICTESTNVWGEVEAIIQCKRSPECVTPPDGITISPFPDDGPLPLNVCEKFPKNVLFPHPRDNCKLCKCSNSLNNMGQYDMQISCIDNPNCRPEPIVTLPPSPHVPSGTCSPIPSEVPFQNPLNPCQVCICTESTDPYGRPDVYIKCDENRECVQPSDAPIIPPIDEDPIPLPSCSKLPTNVPFPHPKDSCKTCKCSVQATASGLQEFISCYTNPECETTPAPSDLSICDRYPPNTLFPDPTDQCKMCKCVLQITPYGKTERHVTCYITPGCSSSTISPVTIHPTHNQNASCAPFPSGRPFQNPLQPCQVCECHEKWGPYGVDVQIECRENPQCVVPEDMTTVPPIIDDVPLPLPICSKFPPNVMFPHPRDHCRVCKCTVQGTMYGPREYITCYANPDCEPPNEIITTPPPDSAKLTCKPLPSGKPFENPMNPCEVCICIETVNAYGERNVRIECQANPQCVTPPEIVTVPSIPDNKTIPLPICNKFPPNVMFPHPRDHCRVCKCTVQGTMYGPQEYITCYANPDCETTPKPIPWKPAPIGPLPGPSPHESCSPYAPDKPFQHPWDECQVCVCSEAFSIGHITIEVNCFTKKSCCIEIPFDISELPSSSTGPYVISPPSDTSEADGAIAIGVDGQKVNLREILDPNNIGNYLKPTGNHRHINVIPNHKYTHNSGGGYYTNNGQSDMRNRVTNNVIRGPIKAIKNSNLNEDLRNDIFYKQQIGSENYGFKHYKVPGSVYSGDVHPQYRMPSDIKGAQINNAYLPSTKGQVVPYQDQRYAYGENPGSIHVGQIKPYTTSERQEYETLSPGYLSPANQGYFPNNNRHVGAEMNGGTQGFNIPPYKFNNQIRGIGIKPYEYPTQRYETKAFDWMKMPLHGLSHGSKLRGSDKMRTKSGRPDDSSQYDEDSGAVE